jgi:hypothetical protein
MVIKESRTKQDDIYPTDGVTLRDVFLGTAARLAADGYFAWSLTVDIVRRLAEVRLDKTRTRLAGMVKKRNQ